jgi:2',5'-phosphodiesterase
VTDVISFQFTPSFLEGDEFRLMTYNLLADLYADSDFSRTQLHPQCPPYALAIDYRKQLLLKEILGFHADIMCLVSPT